MSKQIKKGSIKKRSGARTKITDNGREFNLDLYIKKNSEGVKNIGACGIKGCVGCVKDQEAGGCLRTVRDQRANESTFCRHP